MTACPRCELDPCGCAYITDLRPGGRLDHLRLAAVEGYEQPEPHRAACPCPPCYSRRLCSWGPDQPHPTRHDPRGTR
jgi:hypothetical protein